MSKTKHPKIDLVITCEHGGNLVPKVIQPDVSIPKIILESHRGWDKGALIVAKKVAKELGSFSQFNSTTRLLIDFNRSIISSNLWSPYSPSKGSKSRQILLESYATYRKNVMHYMKKRISKGHSILHLSIHSFTPKLKNEIRKNDIGLLYDPKSESERSICYTLKKSLSENYSVRMNYPYKGTADGFTTFLRTQYPSGYSGIEIELNQRLFLKKNNHKVISEAIQNALTGISIAI